MSEPQMPQSTGPKVNLVVEPQEIVNSLKTQIAQMAMVHAEQRALYEGAIEQLSNLVNEQKSMIDELTTKLVELGIPKEGTTDNGSSGVPEEDRAAAPVG